MSIKENANMEDFISPGKELLSGIRNWIQLIVFVFTLAIGFQFYIFVSQALDGSQITVPRPAGVEGFLPIGALLGWKHFITTGKWDVIHPAAMVFLGFAVIISFFLRKSFCSWFCPVGTLSEWLWKIGESRLGKNYQMIRRIDIPLKGLKYFLLCFFLYIIMKMGLSGISAFLKSPYYKMADVKMLYFFTQMSLLTTAVLLILFILSILFRNFWCRYACPYGALLGIFGLFSPTQIQRNPDNCINCKKCYHACHFHLPVNKKERIVSPECTGCMDCVNICPSKNTLNLKITPMGKALKISHMGFWVILTFLCMVYFATITGHWQSRLTEKEFKMWLNVNDTSMIQHPSVQ